MKEKWEKLLGMKGMPVAALLICTLALLVFFPSAPQETAGMTEEEARIAATLSQISGAGEARVSIYYAETAGTFGKEEKKPMGAVIVARGAGQMEVKLRLLRAAETLLGLSASRVEVFAMEDAP